MTLDELEKRGATCTIEEAADLLGVSRATGYEAARRGELPVLRLGRRLIVPLARLRLLLEGTEPTPETTNGAPTEDAAANTGQQKGDTTSHVDSIEGYPSKARARRTRRT